MRGVNKVTILGRLGKDPETRYSQQGTAFTSFSVATSESRKDKATGEQKEETTWHDVVCIAKLGEIAGQYLKKGSKVYLEGKLRKSSWEQDGQKRYRTEIVARELQMLDEKRAEAPQESSVSDDFDSGIPF